MAASSAMPSVTVKPNFESSVPVSMYSWVWASTPGVTRTSTVGRRAERRGQLLEAVELVEGVGDDAADAERQRGVELVVGLVVAVEHEPLGAGSRRASATWSSPPVATSRCRPSSATSCAMAVQRNAFAA